MQISTRQSISSQDVLHLRLRLLDHILDMFKDHYRRCQPSSWQKVLFDNDNRVGDRVTREAFSLFWDAMIGTLFISQGGEIHLPSITPCRNSEAWEILENTLQLESDYETLVIDFFNSLGEQQQDLLTSPFNNKNIDRLQRYIERQRQECLDLLREFNVPSVPANDMRSTMINIARHTLLEIPSATINPMQAGFFYHPGSTFDSVTEEMVFSWYRELHLPLFEEICSLFSWNPQTAVKGSSRSCLPFPGNIEPMKTFYDASLVIVMGLPMREVITSQ